MDKIGLILLVFAFVLFCIAAYSHTQPYYNRLVAAGLAFLVAALLFGNIPTVFKNTGRAGLIENRVVSG